MQHCAVLEEEDSLVHIVAHEGPPYYFELLPGGKFPLGSSYGEIELTKFSLLNIMWKTFGYQMLLSLQVFYFANSRAIFVVTKNLAENITALEQKCRSAIEVREKSVICDYTTNEIALSLPHATDNGWNITSTFKPAKINMDTIQYYRPGRTPPSIELNIKWKGNGDPINTGIEIGIQGGDSQSFTLFCRPALPITPAGIPRLGPPSRSGPLTHNNPTDLRDAKRVLRGISKEDMRRLGQNLGLSATTVQNYDNRDTISYIDEILNAWLLGRDNVLDQGGPTWGNLRDALLEQGLN